MIGDTFRHPKFQRVMLHFNDKEHETEFGIVTSYDDEARVAHVELDNGDKVTISYDDDIYELYNSETEEVYAMGGPIKKGSRVVYPPTGYTGRVLNIMTDIGKVWLIFDNGLYGFLRIRDLKLSPYPKESGLAFGIFKPEPNRLTKKEMRRAILRTEEQNHRPLTKKQFFEILRGLCDRDTLGEMLDTDGTCDNPHYTARTIDMEEVETMCAAAATVWYLGGRDAVMSDDYLTRLFDGRAE